MEKKSFNPWSAYTQIILGIIFIIQFFIESKVPVWFDYLRLFFGIGIIVFGVFQLRKNKNN